MLLLTSISSYHRSPLSPNVTKMCLKDKRTATKDGMSYTTPPPFVRPRVNDVIYNLLFLCQFRSKFLDLEMV